MSQRVTVQEVDRLAKLSRIGLSPEETQSLAIELAAIVGFVESLNAVEVEGVEPTDQVTGLTGVMRADLIQPSLPAQAIFQNVPERLENYIKVRRVLGG